VYLKIKSKDLYKRLRYMTSANWGMGRMAAKIIYEVVFLPRITYAAQIWVPACQMQKVIKLLGSTQRDPLLAITSCYKTASTNCLSAGAGTLPLYLEVRWFSEKEKHRNSKATYAEYEQALIHLVAEWQRRYDSTEKGE